MIRVLIADDEPLARRGMEQLLAAHHDCEIVASCRNGREAVRALRTSGADVAFLDIQMPGLDGFQVLHTIDPRHTPVIVFVTAHDEFAIAAFEEAALDYLLKPVSQQRFDRALQRVRERLHSRPGAGTALIVPTATGELILDAHEVDWIQAQDYCAALHTGNRRHLIRESLSSLERRLDPASFVRVHRSAIVRLDRVREIRGNGNGVRIVLRDGTELPVSRRRREQVTALIRRR